MPDGLAYLFAVALASVFAYSAAMKFRDVHPTRRALEKADVPRPMLVARIIPVVEIVVVFALLLAPQIGALVSLLLLTAFSAFIVVLLARKIDVSCGCFGANATRSVEPADLVRNVLLAVPAVVALGVAAPHAFDFADLIVVTMSVAIGVLLLNAIRLRRELGQLFDNRLPGER